MNYRYFLRFIVLLACFGCGLPVVAQADLAALLLRFQSEHHYAAQESILFGITQHYPNAGPALLHVANKTKDTQTRYLAIRGIGWLKLKDAAPFLRRSLSSTSSGVRANSAMALGMIRDTSSATDLIQLLAGEQDSGVIEQTSLALAVLGAKEAIPVLKSKANYPSVQTRVWIFGAIKTLGSKGDVPFFATFLSDKDVPVANEAAHAIEKFTGQDFGFLPCSGGPCGHGEEGIRNARDWWSANRKNWEQ
jgi:HEAT repeat protein